MLSFLQPKSVFLLLLIAMSQAVATESKSELIPRVKFYSNDNAWDVQVNSDASLIAYEALANGKPTVWLSSIKSIKKAKPLQLPTSFNFRYFKWSLHPEYLIAFADSKGDERWQLISINIKTGKQVELTPGQGQRAELVGWDNNLPNEVIVAHNQRTPHFNDLYRVNIITGESKLLYQNDDGYTNFYLDNSGTVKLINKRESDDQSFSLFKMSESKQTSIKPLMKVAFEDTRSFRFLRFANDGQTFYVLNSQNRNTAALLKVDYQTGRTETIAESNLADIKEVLFHPVTNKPIAFATDYVDRKWIALDSQYNALFARLSTEFDGRVDITSYSKTDDVLTIYVSGKAASYYALLNLSSGKVQKLVDAYPQLSQYDFPEKVGFKMFTRDGNVQTGTFIAAQGSDMDGDGFPDFPTPMVLMAHGGPWDQSRPGFDTWQLWLANRGYSVLSPNFRASTGLGKQWLNEGNREWGGRIQNDIVDAIQWSIKKGYADKNKIGSLGASFGGYVSLRLLTDKPELLSCAVSTAASPNLISLYQQLPDYWHAFKKEYLFRVGDATTEQGRQLLKQHSPYFFADKITKPLLIFHGANDSRVNISEPRQMVTEMKKNNQQVHFAVSKNTGHGSADPDSELAYQAILEQFFATCLGGQYEPYHHALPESSVEFEAGGEFFKSAMKTN